MRIRAGAESVISELVRRYGARARYRGKRKNARQVAFTGATMNLKRLGLAVFAPAAHLANLLAYYPLHHSCFSTESFFAALHRTVFTLFIIVLHNRINWNCHSQFRSVAKNACY